MLLKVGQPRVLSFQCKGYYTQTPGEVVHNGKGKCQNCSRAEELLNSKKSEVDVGSDSSQDSKSSRYNYVYKDGKAI